MIWAAIGVIALIVLVGLVSGLVGYSVGYHEGVRVTEHLWKPRRLRSRPRRC